jgi:Peptidase M50B-like
MASSAKWAWLGFDQAGALAGLSCAYFLSERTNDFLLRLFGLTSMIYVPLDIFSDTLARPHLHSDARILAELVGGTTQIWGFVWLALSVPIILMALWGSLRVSKK